MLQSQVAKIKRTILLGIVVFLTACSNSAHVPVIESSAQSGGVKATAPQSSVYIVQKGDSLYNIAFRYALDYKKLAAANGIKPPYTIYPGDKLVLKETKQTVKTAVKTTPQPATTKVPVITKPIQAPVVKRSEPVKTTPTPVAISTGQWVWPTKGKIEKTFDNNLSKGIDIAAAIGTPIYSSRAGTVIYAGSQLKGYGNLIIIRHDDIYLSAYAHNREILVKEGQVVKQGEKIAELGMSGTQSPKLHFEIRQNGKPINPLQMLPR